MTTTPGAKPNEPSPIRRTSSPSVSVFWLDLNQVRACLTQAVRRLAETRPEIEEVWLFGSLARGDATPGSDADLLFILSDSTVPFLDRSVVYQPDFCGLGVDILAYTRSELARIETRIQQVQAEGVCLFQQSR